MANSIVSIRIPKSLMGKLVKVSGKKHFLDLSEFVRSVVRHKWLEHNEPAAYQVKKLREEITHLVKDRTRKQDQAELLEELEKLRFLLREREGGKNKK